MLLIVNPVAVVVADIGGQCQGAQGLWLQETGILGLVVEPIHLIAGAGRISFKKIVSNCLNSQAMRCISSWDSPGSQKTTVSPFPAYGSLLNTSA